MPRVYYIPKQRRVCPKCFGKIIAVHDHGSGSRGDQLCINNHSTYPLYNINGNIVYYVDKDDEDREFKEKQLSCCVITSDMLI